MQADALFSYVWAGLSSELLIALCRIAKISDAAGLFSWSDLDNAERIALRPVIADLVSAHYAREQSEVQNMRQIRAWVGEGCQL